MKETYYFSHDYNARNDPKLIELMCEHGISGIGAFWCIIEMLYEQGGTIPITQYKSIAFVLHTDSKMVESIINDFGLFENDGEKFWSNSVKLRLEKAKEVSEKRKKSILSRWDSAKNKKDKYTRNTSVLQNDIKESKVKVKEKEINNNNSFLDRKESETPISPKVKRFKSPTVEEIKGYCEERGNSICPQNFFDYYESNGWKVGKNPMKDWKAAVRQWERREKEFSNNSRNNDVSSPSYYKKL